MPVQVRPLTSIVTVTSKVGIGRGDLGLVGDAVENYGFLLHGDHWLLFGLPIIGWIAL